MAPIIDTNLESSSERVVWYRPMRSRNADEAHRSSTPLELFFDLCVVVAVSFAADQLHEALAAGHFAKAISGYLFIFFAVWWAWMNFTWFASAYDTDDGVFRLTTLVQISGALVLAAGIPRAFNHADYVVITIGYVIMRVATIGQWLRAARSDTATKHQALRYALGIAVVQVGWGLRLLTNDQWANITFILLATAEIAVPVFAERPQTTSFHPKHIAERYGLFTLIVLGESVLATTTAVEKALDQYHDLGSVIPIAISGLLIIFAMWWMYFERSDHGLLTTLRASIMWGYAHYFVFASAAAVGTSLEVAVEHAHVSHSSSHVAGLALAIAVGTFTLTMWILRIRRVQPDASFVYWSGPIATALILLSSATSFAPELIAGVMVLLVVWINTSHDLA